MRFTNICPKCGERDILFIEGTFGLYGGGNHIPPAVLVKRYV